MWQMRWELKWWWPLCVILLGDPQWEQLTLPPSALQKQLRRLHVPDGMSTQWKPLGSLSLLGRRWDRGSPSHQAPGKWEINFYHAGLWWVGLLVTSAQSILTQYQLHPLWYHRSVPLYASLAWHTCEPIAAAATTTAGVYHEHSLSTAAIKKWLSPSVWHSAPGFMVSRWT